MGSTEVIRLAREAAERAGLRLREYNAPEVRYEAADGRSVWWVFFDGRVAMPGYFFAVRVYDQTGETRVFRGS